MFNVGIYMSNYCSFKVEGNNLELPSSFIANYMIKLMLLQLVNNRIRKFAETFNFKNEQVIYLYLYTYVFIYYLLLYII